MARFIILVVLALCSGCASNRGAAELAANAAYDGDKPQTYVTAKVYVTFGN